jgi:hypothetical protein
MGYDAEDNLMTDIQLRSVYELALSGIDPAWALPLLRMAYSDLY